MTIVDIGCSVGVNGMWDIFGDQLQVIGFEPNPEQFRMLPQNGRCHYFNTALGKASGPSTINITRWPYSSGSYKPNLEFWERFPNRNCLEVVDTETIHTVSLDEFCREHSINTIDYIKLDTEGSELAR